MRHYLIVDDNQAFAENLAEIIRDVGDEMTVAGSGAEAISLVKANRYDAIVTDMRMPVMNGTALVHNLRRVDPGLPAIVATAYTGDDDLAAARKEGLLAILPKPVPLDRLLMLLGIARRDGLVVVVEDDTALSDNLSEMLRDRGFSVVTACSIVETERLGPVAPFLALVDLRIPGGPDGAAMVRLGAQFPAMPKMVITAFSEGLPTVAYDELFAKPFNSDSLLHAVEVRYAQRSAA